MSESFIPPSGFGTDPEVFGSGGFGESRSLAQTLFLERTEQARLIRGGAMPSDLFGPLNTTPDKKTIGTAFKEVFDSPYEVLPYINAISIFDSGHMLSLANKAKKGTANQEELAELNARMEDLRRDQSVGYKVVSTALRLPAFAIEFATAGGIIKGAAKGAVATGSRKVLTEFSEELGKKLSTSAAERVSAGLSEAALRKLGVNLSDDAARRMMALYGTDAGMDLFRWTRGFPSALQGAKAQAGGVGTLKREGLKKLGLAAQQAAAEAVPRSILQGYRAIDSYNMHRTPGISIVEGDDDLLYGILVEDGAGFLEAAWKSGIDLVIENFSEQTAQLLFGATALLGGQGAMAAMKAGALNIAARSRTLADPALKYLGADAAFIKNLKGLLKNWGVSGRDTGIGRTISWDGVFGEIMEERVGQALRIGTLIEPIPTADEFMEQILVEGLAFTLNPMMIGQAAQQQYVKSFDATAKVFLDQTEKIQAAINSESDRIITDKEVGDLEALMDLFVEMHKPGQTLIEKIQYYTVGALQRNGIQGLMTERLQADFRQLAETRTESSDRVQILEAELGELYEIMDRLELSAPSDKVSERKLNDVLEQIDFKTRQLTEETHTRDNFVKESILRSRANIFVATDEETKEYIREFGEMRKYQANAGRNKAWLYGISPEALSDPGVKKFIDDNPLAMTKVDLGEVNDQNGRIAIPDVDLRAGLDKKWDDLSQKERLQFALEIDARSRESGKIDLVKAHQRHRLLREIISELPEDRIDVRLQRAYMLEGTKDQFTEIGQPLGDRMKYWNKKRQTYALVVNASSRPLGDGMAMLTITDAALQNPTNMHSVMEDVTEAVLYALGQHQEGTLVADYVTSVINIVRRRAQDLKNKKNKRSLAEQREYQAHLKFLDTFETLPVEERTKKIVEVFSKTYKHQAGFVFISPVDTSVEPSIKLAPPIPQAIHDALNSMGVGRIATILGKTFEDEVRAQLGMDPAQVQKVAEDQEALLAAQAWEESLREERQRIDEEEAAARAARDASEQEVEDALALLQDLVGDTEARDSEAPVSAPPSAPSAQPEFLAPADEMAPDDLAEPMTDEQLLRDFEAGTLTSAQAEEALSAFNRRFFDPDARPEARQEMATTLGDIVTAYEQDVLDRIREEAVEREGKKEAEKKSQSKKQPKESTQDSPSEPSATPDGEVSEFAWDPTTPAESAQTKEPATASEPVPERTFPLQVSERTFRILRPSALYRDIHPRATTSYEILSAIEESDEFGITASDLRDRFGVNYSRYTRQLASDGFIEVFNAGETMGPPDMWNDTYSISGDAELAAQEVIATFRMYGPKALAGPDDSKYKLAEVHGLVKDVMRTNPDWFDDSITALANQVPDGIEAEDLLRYSQLHNAYMQAAGSEIIERMPHLTPALFSDALYQVASQFTRELASAMTGTAMTDINASSSILLRWPQLLEEDVENVSRQIREAIVGPMRAQREMLQAGMPTKVPPKAESLLEILKFPTHVEKSGMPRENPDQNFSDLTFSAETPEHFLARMTEAQQQRLRDEILIQESDLEDWFFGFSAAVADEQGTEGEALTDKMEDILNEAMEMGVTYNHDANTLNLIGRVAYANKIAAEIFGNNPNTSAWYQRNLGLDTLYHHAHGIPLPKTGGGKLTPYGQMMADFWLLLQTPLSEELAFPLGLKPGDTLIPRPALTTMINIAWSMQVESQLHPVFSEDGSRILSLEQSNRSTHEQASNATKYRFRNPGRKMVPGVRMHRMDSHTISQLHDAGDGFEYQVLNIPGVEAIRGEESRKGSGVDGLDAGFFNPLDLNEAADGMIFQLQRYFMGQGPGMETDQKTARANRQKLRPVLEKAGIRLPSYDFTMILAPRMGDKDDVKFYLVKWPSDSEGKEMVQEYVNDYNAAVQDQDAKVAEHAKAMLVHPDDLGKLQGGWMERLAYYKNWQLWKAMFGGTKSFKGVKDALKRISQAGTPGLRLRSRTPIRIMVFDDAKVMDGMALSGQFNGSILRMAAESYPGIYGTAPYMLKVHMAGRDSSGNFINVKPLIFDAERMSGDELVVLSQLAEYARRWGVDLVPLSSLKAGYKIPYAGSQFFDPAAYRENRRGIVDMNFDPTPFITELHPDTAILLPSPDKEMSAKVVRYFRQIGGVRRSLPADLVEPIEIVERKLRALVMSEARERFVPTENDPTDKLLEELKKEILKHDSESPMTDFYGKLADIIESEGVTSDILFSSFEAHKLMQGLGYVMEGQITDKIERMNNTNMMGVDAATGEEFWTVDENGERVLYPSGYVGNVYHRSERQKVRRLVGEDGNGNQLFRETVEELQVSAISEDDITELLGGGLNSKQAVIEWLLNDPKNRSRFWWMFETPTEGDKAGTPTGRVRDYFIHLLPNNRWGFVGEGLQVTRAPISSHTFVSNHTFKSRLGDPTRTTTGGAVQAAAVGMNHSSIQASKSQDADGDFSPSDMVTIKVVRDRGGAPQMIGDSQLVDRILPTDDSRTGLTNRRFLLQYQAWLRKDEVSTRPRETEVEQFIALTEPSEGQITPPPILTWKGQQYAYALMQDSAKAIGVAAISSRTQRDLVYATALTTDEKEDLGAVRFDGEIGGTRFSWSFDAKQVKKVFEENREAYMAHDHVYGNMILQLIVDNPKLAAMFSRGMTLETTALLYGYAIGQISSGRNEAQIVEDLQRLFQILRSPLVVRYSQLMKEASRVTSRLRLGFLSDWNEVEEVMALSASATSVMESLQRDAINGRFSKAEVESLWRLIQVSQSVYKIGRGINIEFERPRTDVEFLQFGEQLSNAYELTRRVKDKRTGKLWRPIPNFLTQKAAERLFGLSAEKMRLYGDVMFNRYTLVRQVPLRHGTELAKEMEPNPFNAGLHAKTLRHMKALAAAGIHNSNGTGANTFHGYVANPGMAQELWGSQLMPVLQQLKNNGHPIKNYIVGIQVPGEKPWIKLENRFWTGGLVHGELAKAQAAWDSLPVATKRLLLGFHLTRPSYGLSTSGFGGNYWNVLSPATYLSLVMESAQVGKRLMEQKFTEQDYETYWSVMAARNKTMIRQILSQDLVLGTRIGPTMGLPPALPFVGSMQVGDKRLNIIPNVTQFTDTVYAMYGKPMSPNLASAVIRLARVLPRNPTANQILQAVRENLSDLTDNDVRALVQTAKAIDLQPLGVTVRKAGQKEIPVYEVERGEFVFTAKGFNTQIARDEFNYSLGLIEDYLAPYFGIFAGGSAALHEQLIEYDRMAKTYYELTKVKRRQFEHDYRLDGPDAPNWTEDERRMIDMLLSAVAAQTEGSDVVVLDKSVNSFENTEPVTISVGEIMSWFRPGTDIREKWDAASGGNRHSLRLDQMVERYKSMLKEAREIENRMTRDFSDEDWVALLQDYIHHRYQVDLEDVELDPVSFIRQNPRPQLRRMMDTYERAVKERGLLPITMNAMDLYEMRGREMASAIYRKMFLSMMPLMRSESGLPMMFVRLNRIEPDQMELIPESAMRRSLVMLSEIVAEDPKSLKLAQIDGRKPLHEEYNRLSDLIAERFREEYEHIKSPFEMPGGKTKRTRKRSGESRVKSNFYAQPRDTHEATRTQIAEIYVTKGDPAKLLRHVIGRKSSNAFVKIVEGFNSLAKTAQLSLSFFHPFALMESMVAASGLTSRNVVFNYEAWQAGEGWGKASAFWKHAQDERRKISQALKRGDYAVALEWTRNGLQTNLLENRSVDAQPQIADELWLKMIRYFEDRARVEQSRIERLLPRDKAASILQRLKRQGRTVKLRRPDIESGERKKAFFRRLATTAKVVHGLKMKMDQWLWNDLHPVIKLYMAEQVYQRRRQRAIDEKLPWDDRQERRAISAYINNAFGGQEWVRYIWATPQARQVMHLLIFAPDWSISALQVAGVGNLARFPFLNALRHHVPSGIENEEMIKHYWPAMVSLVLFGIPNALQAVMWGATRIIGGDDDDKPFSFQNEYGKRTSVDITPAIRAVDAMLPFWEADYGPSGKQRYYLRWGKQAYEVADYFTEPVTRIKTKSSVAARALYEQVTGTNTAGWDLPFRDHGLKGLIESDEGFGGSRIGVFSHSLMPFTMLATMQGQPATVFAPGSKGMSFSRAVFEMADIMSAYAATGGAPLPGPAKTTLEGLAPQILDAAIRNGYNPVEVAHRAKSHVLADLYAEYFNALEDNNTLKLEKLSRQILRVNGRLENVVQSMEKKYGQYGRDFNVDQLKVMAEGFGYVLPVEE